MAPGFKLPTLAGGDVEYVAPPEIAIVLTFVKFEQDKSADVLRELNKLESDVAGGTQVLAVLVGVDEGTDPSGWITPMGLGFPVLIDKNQEIYSKYGVMVAPQTAIITPKGEFVAEVAGHTAGFKAEVEGKLRDVLGIKAKEDPSAEVAEELPEARKKAMRELQRARMLIDRKMKSKAMPQVKQALESDETYGEAHILMSQLLLEEGGEANVAEAKKHLERAAALEPNDTEVKVGLARIMAESGDYEGAVKSLEDAAKVSPKSEHIYYYLGQIHEEKGNFEQAAKSYRMALEKIFK